jgi:hypothetical protein
MAVRSLFYTIFHWVCYLVMYDLWQLFVIFVLTIMYRADHNGINWIKNIFALFIPCIVAQWLHYRTKQMHTCYNVISQYCEMNCSKCVVLLCNYGVGLCYTLPSVDFILFDRYLVWRPQRVSMRNPWLEVLEMARVKKPVGVQLCSAISYACLAVNIASIEACYLEVSVKED